MVAHGLYTNAVAKGEECIITTWDIFYEKFGWMLHFWNGVGVPFVYTFQSFFLMAHAPQIVLSSFQTGVLVGALLVIYYVWDSAQSQKNSFRMNVQHRSKGSLESIVNNKCK